MDQAASGSGGRLLVVDFRRPDARPTLTAAILPHLALTVCRLDPIADLTASGGAADPAELAAAYVERLVAMAQRPDVVAGYCNAGTLALQVARLLAESGRVAPCVLVDPSWPTPATIRAEFAALRVSLGVAPADAATQRCEPTVEAMTRQLRHDLLTMLDEDGAEPDEAEIAAAALLPRYRAWLGFLLASSAHPPEPAADSHVICGRETAAPAAWLPDQWRPTVLDLPSADLLQPGSSAPELIARRITALVNLRGLSS
ncbi:Thioesterase domain [Micromonospora haikouensis]|uniref:Thioesterase domain n=1 Tax=Micromonospora haikouensis TaxID=686309 RepID=A0A1C4XEH1_9ACTN|nr:Thioesterase domain [Micromonospora haikouensis]